MFCHIGKGIITLAGKDVLTIIFGRESHIDKIPDLEKVREYPSRSGCNSLSRGFYRVFVSID
jgi:hypothetical protein